MLIALSGFGGAGKDTVGDILVRHCGFTRYAFADALKETASHMTGIPLEYFHDRILKFEPLPEWDELTPAQIAIKLGTEVGRHIHPDVWMRKTMRQIAGRSNVVITDLRFPNEAKAVRVAGGLLVRVEREGCTPRIDLATGEPHISETALNDWHFDDVVHNSGVMGSLSTYVVNDGMERWRKSIEIKRQLEATFAQHGVHQ